MPILLRLPLAIALMTTVAACGGSSTGGGGGGGGSIQDNGLPAGALGQQLSEAEGVEMTLQGATAQLNQSGSISTGTVEIDSGFIAGNTDATITILGENITITDGNGVLSNGDIVTVIFEDDRSGTYAGAIEVVVTSLNNTDAELGYVFGFETDADDLPTGAISYLGGFQAAGFEPGETNRLEYEGTVTIDVDFASGGPSTAGVDLSGQIEGGNALDLSGENFALDGNSFGGTLGCDAGCTTSTSQVNATFYGPNAEELGGVLSIDTDVFNGAGTFIIDVNGPPS